MECFFGYKKVKVDYRTCIKDSKTIYKTKIYFFEQVKFIEDNIRSTQNPLRNRDITPKTR